MKYLIPFIALSLCACATRKTTHQESPHIPEAAPMSCSQPLIPIISNHSPSYDVRTSSDQMNARQRAYAEALQEQNRVMKRRMESSQQDAGKVQKSDHLEKQIESNREPAPASHQPNPIKIKEGEFLGVEPKLSAKRQAVTNQGEMTSLADPSDQSQATLISQMRSNNESAK